MAKKIAIGLFMVVLTAFAHEQASNKNLSKQGEPSIIVADWTFEEGNPGADILTVKDYSGNDHDLVPLVPL
jgi:hypothetical protein